MHFICLYKTIEPVGDLELATEITHSECSILLKKLTISNACANDFTFYLIFYQSSTFF
jgi:hypothetical protein